MEIAIAVNFGNAHIHLKADDLDEFKLGMGYLESQGILTRNGGQPAEAVVGVQTVGTLSGETAPETKAEEKPKGARKPKKDEAAKAEPAAEAYIKDEPKTADPEARAVTKEDVMNAVSAYGNALAQTGLSETEAVAKIRADLYSKYEIKRAGELPEARWADFVAEVSALTAALVDGGAPAEDENLL